MNDKKPFHAYFTLFAMVMASVFLPFSVRLCHAALFLLILSWIFYGEWKEKWNSIVSNPVIIVFVLFFALHFVGVLYTEEKVSGWFNIEKKVCWIIIPIILVSIPRLEKKYIDLIFQSFIAACFVGTILCLIHAISKLFTSGSTVDLLESSLFWSFNPEASKRWMFFSYTELASGINIHPTYFSMYLVFCMLLLFRMFHKGFFERPKVIQLLLIMLFFYFSFFIIFLSSRITTIAFLFFVFIGIYQFFEKAKPMKRMIFSFLITSFFVILIYFNPVTRYRNYQEMTHISYPAPKAKPYHLSADMRASLWWVGIKSLKTVDLIWGAGTGDVEEVMKNTGLQYSVSNILGTNNPHNQFLYTLLSLGFVGLLSLLSCFVLPAYLAYQKQDFFYLAFISLFVFVSLTETVLELQKGIVFFSLFNSLLLYQCADWSVLYKKKEINYV